MKRLILMRHAKSSWENLKLRDHDRSLNERGQNDCKLIAAWLKEHDYLPDRVICSTARRCVETWEAVSASADCSAEIEFKQSLYHASPQLMIEQLRATSGNTVMILAHNPGIGECANMMLATAPQHPRFIFYPTAATTVIDLDINDWGALETNNSANASFITPKDLRG